MWETLDLEAMLREGAGGTSSGMGVGVAGATTTANVGAYQVPLGAPISASPRVWGAEDAYQKRVASGEIPYSSGYDSAGSGGWMTPSKI